MHKHYRAACERLRRIEAGEKEWSVYGHGNYWGLEEDKSTIYDALHDREPATVEWCKQLDANNWSRSGVLYRKSDCGKGVTLLIARMKLVELPTRGQVMMLCEVFGEVK